jgi:hypothetical protein
VARDSDDSLTVLEREDRRLAELFVALGTSNGETVSDRAARGRKLKEILLRLAIREAAETDITSVLDNSRLPEAIRQRLMEDDRTRRTALNEFVAFCRGVAPVDLLQTDGLVGAVDAIREVVLPELDWELAEGIPRLHDALSDSGRRRLRRARYFARHSPTRASASWLTPHVSLVTRALANWYHLKDLAFTDPKTFG